jgi:thymidylate kinase
VSSREDLAEELCSLVDEVLEGRAIVVGSLPPHGTDLDLLVRPPEEVALRAGLRSAGLAEHGDRLLCAGVGVAVEVELKRATDWNLPRGELDSLYAETTTLPGRQHLAEAAPHHRLLILATRTLAAGKPLSERRRSRIERALAVDPMAWEKAMQRAPLWGGERGLRRMRELYESGRVAPADRVRRRLGQVRRLGRRIRRGRGLLVTFSGVDGSGKSSQTEALKGALESLGLRTRVEWVPLAWNRWLDRLAAPFKWMLARFGGFRPAQSEAAGSRGREPSPGSILRERSRAVNYSWATLVAIENGIAHAVRGRRHRSRGQVVVFDRYVLDSVARLRLFYGQDRPFRLQRGLIRLLSPRPDLAFFLDLPAPASISRKQDFWSPDELERQVELLREEQRRSGITRLDAERSLEDLAREILEATWRRLQE